MKPLLDIRGLTVEYRDAEKWVPVIEDVDLQVAEGEIVGLVGESGCGKSTTANAILRLSGGSTRTRGSIFFDGRDLLTLDAQAMRRIRGAEIAMIPQDPMSSLNPLFTIGSQIAEALTAHNTIDRKQVREEVVRSLERLHIPSPETRVGQHPHELSGGMRQRVVGAIAMASSPRLLIADEPTTALDVTVQARFLDVLSSLQRENNMAMMFVTHDLGVIARICDRVAVMYAGRVVEHATVKELFAAPKHWYTRALLDSVPEMDRKPARLASIDGAPPRPGDAISGCRFSPRCTRAEDKCRADEPAAQTVGPGHDVRCWFPCESGQT